MEKRILRPEDDVWHIRTENGELSKAEQSELLEYFGEIRLPYRLVNDCLCIPDEVDRESVFERLEHFYDGCAEVFPF